MPSGDSSLHYVGLDVHKHVVVTCILGTRGQVLGRHQVPCTRAGLERFARQHLRSTDRVVLEATANTWEVVNLLNPFVAEVVVSNPLRTQAIAEAKIKTDKVDALVLAQLLRCDFLPRVWEPGPDTQRLRRLTARRASLVMDKTAIKNRIHALLHQRLLAAPVKDLFSGPGRAWLQTLPLDAEGQRALASDLRLLEAVEEEIAQQEHLLAQVGYADSQVKLLLTLPGVDLTVAQTLLATLGDVTRFRDGAHAASYLGLVPSTKQSAATCYHGPITRQGNGHARAMLVQAAQHLGTHPGPRGAFFRRLSKRKNRSVAVVATARKLVVIAWQMLKNQEPYRYAQPATTQLKFNRLRLKATGEKQKCGARPGTTRAPTYGSGEHTRPVPSLPQVLSHGALPPAKSVEQLSRGELRVLRQTKTLAFVEQIQHPHRRVIQKAAPPKEESTANKEESTAKSAKRKRGDFTRS
jgi:transposase